uniref:Uncharacterized protein n=1 Tax=Panagrolaimus davidi TaxID=227884 RepID=A0A914QR87_9BILA
MAENIEEEKYQTSEEFEHPIFGCLEEVSGEDISNDVLEHFQCYGLPGDIVTQYIPKLLGGYDSGDNSFNLNPTANIKEWKAGLTKCYEHLKKDKKNIVRIIYIIGYQKGEIRPCDIFYNFKLYSNNIEKPDETVEGKFHNPVPKVNHHDGI